jgi:hypothetical protein
MDSLIALYITLLSFGSLVLSIWAIIDIVKKPFQPGKDKTLWLLLICMFGLFGTVLYVANRQRLLAETQENREYLPDLEDDNWSRPQASRPRLAERQSRWEGEDDQYV